MTDESNPLDGIDERIVEAREANDFGTWEDLLEVVDRSRNEAVGFGISSAGVRLSPLDAESVENLAGWIVEALGDLDLSESQKVAAYQSLARSAAEEPLMVSLAVAWNVEWLVHDQAPSGGLFSQAIDSVVESLRPYLEEKRR